MNHYVRIPNKLVETCVLQNRAHYLGIYAFIGRHYLITHKPVVLSANDLLQFDPSLSYGQSVRALNWLCENGWAVPTTHKGQKTCYLPSWGLVGGQPVAWDATDQRFGRRPHQQAYVRLDVRIFDVYMGTLTLHSEYRAQRRGYITAPLLSLADVGSFVQRHLGYGKPTEALFQYGLVSTAGNVRPLPSDKTILTQASQRNLLQPDAPYITEAGLTRLGILQSEPLVADQTSHLLFFIPRDKIDGGIERMIGRMIDPAPAPQVAFSPSVCQIQPIPGTIESMREKSHEVPEKHDPPQHSTNEGADSISRPILTIPDTEAVATLRKFAIRSGKPINPRVLIELSSLSLDDISYGINVASVAQNVRDPVALAVATIRDRRDYKDTLPTPPAYNQPENQMLVDIEKYGSLIRLGSDTSDLPPNHCGNKLSIRQDQPE